MNYDFLDPNISDKEFAQRFVRAYEDAMKDVNPDDYVIDQVQLQKLNDLIEFFKTTAINLGGKIESVSLNPAAPSNGITANFIVFDLFGDEVQRFCDVIRHCSAISMDVTVDKEISISCTVPNIYTHK